MNAGTRNVSIFVDRPTGEWIVRDADGGFWRLPPGERAWDRRRPYVLAADSDLVPVPKHYEYLLDLPTTTARTATRTV